MLKDGEFFEAPANASFMSPVKEDLVDSSPVFNFERGSFIARLSSSKRPEGVEEEELLKADPRVEEQELEQQIASAGEPLATLCNDPPPASEVLGIENITTEQEETKQEPKEDNKEEEEEDKGEDILLLEVPAPHLKEELTIAITDPGSLREEQLRTTETHEEKVPAPIRDTKELSPSKEKELTEEQSSYKRRSRKDRSSQRRDEGNTVGIQSPQESNCESPKVHLRQGEE